MTIQYAGADPRAGYLARYIVEISCCSEWYEILGFRRRYGVCNTP